MVIMDLEQLNVHSSRDIIARHGLTLPKLFELSLEFYKEEKHQFNLSYDQKNQLAAYYRQSTLGPYHPDKLNPGYFDFVGNDRKKAWEALGEISSNGAMAGFCNLLETVCPDLVPWIRHKKRTEEKILKEEEARKAEERRKIEEEELEASKLINIVKRAEGLVSTVASPSGDPEPSSDEEEEMPGLEKSDRKLPQIADPPVNGVETSEDSPRGSSPNGVEPTTCPELRLPETEATPAAPGVTPVAEDATPAAPGVTLAAPEATPPAEDATPAAPGVTPAAPEATPTAEEATTAAEDATTAAEEVTPAAEDATPVAENSTPAAPEVTPVAPEATPAAEDSTQAAENATQVAENATQAAGDATQAAEDATQAAGDAIPAAEDATPAAENATLAAPEATPAAEDTTQAAPENATPAAPEEATDPAMQAVLAQHFACVMYLRNLKDSGQVLTDEQEVYLQQMSVYNAQMNALQKSLQSKPTETEIVEETVETETVAEAVETEAVAEAVETVEEAVETVAEAVVAAIEERTENSESGEMLDSQDSFAVVSPSVVSIDTAPVGSGVDETVLEEAVKSVQSTESEQSAEPVQSDEPVQSTEQVQSTVQSTELTNGPVQLESTDLQQPSGISEAQAVIAEAEVLLAEETADISVPDLSIPDVLPPAIPASPDIPTSPGTPASPVIPASEIPTSAEIPTPTETPASTETPAPTETPAHISSDVEDSGAPANAQSVSALADTLKKQLPDVATSPSEGGDSDSEVQMWSKTGVDMFIREVSEDADSILNVGRGETVTVRIPTYESGNALYWEFATEHYDIGFGASFEWEEEEGKVRREPILPILRRSSQEKVITGSHAYPRSGTYLLLFDNSYSLLRSKTVYYRVFYTR